jgi:hypothetical protein
MSCTGESSKSLLQADFMKADVHISIKDHSFSVVHQFDSYLVSARCSAPVSGAGDAHPNFGTRGRVLYTGKLIHHPLFLAT